MNIYSFLIIISFLSIPSTAKSTNKWGELEILGANSEQRNAIKNNSNIVVGADAPEINNVGEIIYMECDRAKSYVKETGMDAGCSVVLYPSRIMHLAIDIFYPESAGVQNSNGGWIDRPGNYDINPEKAVECSVRCMEASDRVASYKVFQNFNITDSLCRAALVGVQDVNASVRNYASQFLNFNYKNCRRYLTANEMVSVLSMQLQRHSHSDRNKSIATIQIIAGDTGLQPDCEWGLLMDFVRYLSVESVLPNVGGIAKKIVSQVEDEKEKFNPSMECQ